MSAPEFTLPARRPTDDERERTPHITLANHWFTGYYTVAADDSDEIDLFDGYEEGFVKISGIGVTPADAKQDDITASLVFREATEPRKNIPIAGGNVRFDTDFFAPVPNLSEGGNLRIRINNHSDSSVDVNYAVYGRGELVEDGEETTVEPLNP